MPMTVTRPETESVAGFDVSLGRDGKQGEPLTDGDRLWPALMRRVVRAHMSLWGLGALAGTAELLMSELVTNALEHGHGTVGVRVWRTETQLCAEVLSAGPRTARVREAGPYDESGRGLQLVAALADGWGVSADGVWCALAIGGT
ncbi:ATP-binding protein [Streptomyces sp. NPDC004609]|uniref:ATP-binding protein n=1 Tax=Streptomyces sp. NPDC004609 TaxID=3364704 RepID=UPI00367B263B